MKKPRSYSWILKTRNHAVSVNNSYGVAIKDGRAVMYKTKECRDYMAELQGQMDFLNTPDWIHETGKTFKLYVKVLLREGLYQRDLDNTLKSIQDSIARSPKFGFNDSRIIQLSCDKQIIPGSPHETLVCELTEFLGETRFDVLSSLPRPCSIFLGGTCAGDPWRKDVIKWLEENKRYPGMYYDPVVPDWTPDCVQKENDYKENEMDCFFCILTPRMKGVYSIAEILHEVYQVRDNGFGSVLLGILGGESEWGTGMWRSLQATIDLIKKVSGGSKNIIAEFIENPVDLCAFLDQGGWKGKRKPKK